MAAGLRAEEECSMGDVLRQRSAALKDRGTAPPHAGTTLTFSSLIGIYSEGAEDVT